MPRVQPRGRRSSSVSSTAPAPAAPASSKRKGDKRPRPTVYDAVAGRISTAGRRLSAPSSSTTAHTRDTLSHSTIPLPPGEVLFRSSRAPDRFAEDDIYTAHRHLDPVDPLQRLPSSDLLKAVHVYVGEFYAKGVKAGGRGGGGDYRSLDETALIAVGILLEEACAAVLEGTGDLAFAEGEVLEETVAGPDDGDDAIEDIGDSQPDLNNRAVQDNSGPKTHAEQNTREQRPNRSERATKRRRRAYADNEDY